MKAEELDIVNGTVKLEILEKTLNCYLYSRENTDIEKYIGRLSSAGYDLCEFSNYENLKGLIQNNCEYVEPTDKETLNLLIKMYINGQYIRGQDSSELRQLTGFPIQSLLYEFNQTTGNNRAFYAIKTDSINNATLKEILGQKQLREFDVGKKGLSYMMTLLLHADQDSEFQRSNLQYAYELMKANEISKSKYAYFYDRIMIGQNKEQLYGTQLRRIDAVNQLVELEPTEDIAELDRRRMHMDLMPIEFYKKLLLEVYNAGNEI